MQQDICGITLNQYRIFDMFDPSTFGWIIWMGLVCRKYGGDFDTLWFCMETAFRCSNLGPHLNGFNLYVMGKKYMLSLLSVILVLCNRVESSKITSYFEQFWTKYFHFGWQNVSLYFSSFVKTDWHVIPIFTEYLHCINM